MEEDFKLPEDMFTDNPKFVDTSHEFDDDCGDACKIWLIIQIQTKWYTVNKMGVVIIFTKWVNTLYAQDIG